MMRGRDPAREAVAAALRAWLDAFDQAVVPPPDLHVRVTAPVDDRQTMPAAAQRRRWSTLVPAVRAGRTRSGRRTQRPRRWIAAGAATLVCAVAVVPPARAAVVDAAGEVLRLAGVEVRRESDAVPLPVSPSPLPSVRAAGLDEARRLARFTVLVPAVLGVPERVTLADPDPTGAPRVVSLSYRGGLIRLDQLDGALEPSLMKSAADAEWTTIGSQEAIWLPGPHPVTYVDRTGVERTEAARLAGPTLIWTANSVTYRLEGLPTLEQARAVAESLR